MNIKKGAFLLPKRGVPFTKKGRSFLVKGTPLFLNSSTAFIDSNLQETAKCFSPPFATRRLHLLLQTFRL